MFYHIPTVSSFASDWTAKCTMGIVEFFLIREIDSFEVLYLVNYHTLYDNIAANSHILATEKENVLGSFA